MRVSLSGHAEPHVACVGRSFRLYTHIARCSIRATQPVLRASALASQWAQNQSKYRLLTSVKGISDEHHGSTLGVGRQQRSSCAAIVAVTIWLLASSNDETAAVAC